MFATALLVGGALGVRHAFEADHVAAVAAMVDENDRPGSTGLAWGVGHSAPILLLGGLFLALGVGVPDSVAAGFEAAVGVVLVGLGVRALLGSPPVGRAVVGRLGRGEEAENGDHGHVRIRGRAIGLGHSHVDRESFGVGVVHGLAGSGGVVVALAATAATPGDGAAFLVGFAVATVAAMAAASWGLGRAAGYADGVRVLGGAASVLVGLLLLADLAGFATPL